MQKYLQANLLSTLHQPISCAILFRYQLWSDHIFLMFLSGGTDDQIRLHFRGW
jgi:hypothetical protein